MPAIHLRSSRDKKRSNKKLMSSRSLEDFFFGALFSTKFTAKQGLKNFLKKIEKSG